MKSQIDVVQAQQLDVAWRNYVHERIKDGSAAQQRCKRLILDLAHAGGTVAKKDLTSVSPRVLKLYQGKTDRTLARDINALKEMGLLEYVPRRGFRARTEIILAFLPDQKPRDPGSVALVSNPTRPA